MKSEPNLQKSFSFCHIVKMFFLLRPSVCCCASECICVCASVVLCHSHHSAALPRSAPPPGPVIYLFYIYCNVQQKDCPARAAFPLVPSPSLSQPACFALLPLCLWSFWGFCATHTHLVCSLRLRPVRTWTSLLRFVLVQASTRAASLPELTGHGLRLSCAHCTGLYGSAIPSSPATWPY